MKHYRHVLIASDLKEGSDLIAKKAAEIAEKNQAKLSIVHMLELLPLQFGGFEFAMPIDPDLETELMTKAEQALTQQAENVNIPKENQYLEKGLAQDQLRLLVLTLNVDLLVLGYHQQSGLASMFGATANTLLHQMPCDILVVRI